MPIERKKDTAGPAAAEVGLRGGSWQQPAPRNHTKPSSGDRLRSATTFPFDGRLRSQREAEAAMKLAISTDGVDRQELIRLAMAWRELARARLGPDSRLARAT